MALWLNLSVMACVAYSAIFYVNNPVSYMAGLSARLNEAYLVNQRDGENGVAGGYLI